MRGTWTWLSAGVLYVAAVAAAMVWPRWVVADLVWLVTFLAVVYAASGVFVGGGRGRAAGLGFVIAGVLTALALYSAEESSPTYRAIAAAAPAYTTASVPNQSVVSFLVTRVGPDGKPVMETRTRTVNNFVVQTTVNGDQQAAFAARLLAANAASIMLAGLVGGVFAAAAFRRERREGS